MDRSDSLGLGFPMMKRRFLLSILTCISLTTVAQTDSLMVYVFLSETCPICKSTTPELQSLYRDYSSKGISFTGVFPNKSVSSIETREAFASKYKLKFPLIGDPEHAITNRLNAQITPEVFVVRVKNNELIYRGLIDNSYIRVGKRRSITTAFYLRNALEQYISGQTSSIQFTEAVGCIIQK